MILLLLASVAAFAQEVDGFAEVRVQAYAGVDADLPLLVVERLRPSFSAPLGDRAVLATTIEAGDRAAALAAAELARRALGPDYEVMMATADFDEMYTGVVAGSDSVNGRKAWVLEATAKDSAVAYPKRKIWIDAELMIPAKQELYALSGMLLKTWTMSDIKVVDGKNVPMKMVIADMLKEGSSTTLITESLTFDVPLEEETFSRRWLERKD